MKLPAPPFPGCRWPPLTPMRGGGDPPPAVPRSGGGSPYELREGNVEDTSDREERVQRGIGPAGLDVLVVAPVQRDREEHRFLREVPVETCGANLTADPLSFLEEPLIVVGPVTEHSTEAVTRVIICQPGHNRLSLINSEYGQTSGGRRTFVPPSEIYGSGALWPHGICHRAPCTVRKSNDCSPERVNVVIACNAETGWG